MDKKKIEVVYNIYDSDGNKIVDGVKKEHAELISLFLNSEHKN